MTLPSRLDPSEEDIWSSRLSTWERSGRSGFFLLLVPLFRATPVTDERTRPESLSTKRYRWKGINSARYPRSESHLSVVDAWLDLPLPSMPRKATEPPRLPLLIESIARL